MVSMQYTSLSLEVRTPIAMNNLEKLLSSKKRKWEEKEGDEEEEGGRETSKSFKYAEAKPNSFDHIELHIDTPLPLEWQRCLDIKSGEIHFYNTRTHTRTSKDPWQQNQNQNPEPSLDLELNLSCKTEKSTSRIEADNRRSSSSSNNNSRAHKDDNLAHDLYRPSPLPPAPVEPHQQEMVAGVCMRCHMLVMMCKAAPSCPNCKFVYSSLMQCSPLLLKPNSGLFLSCKD